MADKCGLCSREKSLNEDGYCEVCLGIYDLDGDDLQDTCIGSAYEIIALTAQLTEAKTEIVEQNEINTKQGHACVNYLKKIEELKAENARYREALGAIKVVHKRPEFKELTGCNFYGAVASKAVKIATTALNGEGDNDAGKT